MGMSAKSGAAEKSPDHESHSVSISWQSKANAVPPATASVADRGFIEKKQHPNYNVDRIFTNFGHNDTKCLNVYAIINI